MNIFSFLFRRPKHIEEEDAWSAVDNPVPASRSHGTVENPRIGQTRRKVKSLTAASEIAECMRSYDGYLRQAAIGRSVTLAYPELLPAIAERLNDWVRPVLDSARDAVITLLPLMPPAQVIALLPRIDALRRTRRWDCKQWLELFEKTLVRWVRVDELVAAAASAELLVSRASFDILRRHALIPPESLIELGLNSRRDVILMLRAAQIIGQLGPAQGAKYYALAMESHFLPVRLIALRALLQDPTDAAQTELAVGLLLNPRSSARDAAIGFLARSSFDVRAFYRDVLVDAHSAPAALRAALAGMSQLQSSADAPLAKELTAHASASVRKAAFAAWVRLAKGDKDTIARLALADSSSVIRKAALDLIQRQGAYIPFEVVCEKLLECREFHRLLKYGTLEKWIGLESIARVAMANAGDAEMLELARAQLLNWCGGPGSFTRPTPGQTAFFSAAQTQATLTALAPDKPGVNAFIQDEIAIALGTRRQQVS